MTVLFGFSSSSLQSSFLGADDRESGHKKPINKVAFAFDRFLIGGIGYEAAFLAAKIISDPKSDEIISELAKEIAPTNEDLVPPNSIEEFFQRICRYIPNIHARLERDLDQLIDLGKVPLTHKEFLKKQSSNLVFIDTQQYEWVLVEFGYLFCASESETKPTFRELSKCFPSDQVLRFAISDGNAPYGINLLFDAIGCVTANILEHPFQWCEEQINEAQDIAKRQGHHDLLGALGSCYLIKEGTVKSRTLSDQGIAIEVG